MSSEKICKNCGKLIEFDLIGGVTGYRHVGSLLVRCSPLRLDTLAEPRLEPSDAK